MKKIIVSSIVLVVGVILIVVAFGIYKFNFTNDDIHVACTQEAKLCSDGSTVGRTGPNCEFTLCPSEMLCEGEVCPFKTDVQTENTLIVPEVATNFVIQQLFVKKYPQYADTIRVGVTSETSSHVRGMVIMMPDVGGNIFLATKIDGQWQIVFDDNGAISCDLSRYGFPAEMLEDCAK